MKQLYTLLFLLFFALQTNAQDFVYSPAQTMHTDLVTDTYAYPEMSFVTSPLGAIQYEWELIGNDIPTGWSYSLCDYNLCYAGIPATGTMAAIDATEAANGTKGYFKLTVSAWQIAGTATVDIYVYDINDYNVGDTVTFTFTHVSSVGVGENVLADLTIYPNPATDAVTIGNISPEITQLQVMNVVGEVVKNISLTGKNTETLDVSDYPAGIYFVSYANSEGTTRTEKLVIK